MTWAPPPLQVAPRRFDKVRLECYKLLRVVVRRYEVKLSFRWPLLVRIISTGSTVGLVLVLVPGTVGLVPVPVWS